MEDPLANYEDSFAGIKLHLSQTEPMTALSGERLGDRQKSTLTAAMVANNDTCQHKE